MTRQIFSGFVAAGLLTLLMAGRAEPLPERIEQRPLPAPAPSDFSAFAAAVETGDATTVVRLLDGNAGWIQTPIGGDGWTALQMSIRFGRQEVTEVLILAGADVDRANPYGWTAVHYAAMNGNIAALRLLLKNGADGNRKAQQGETPLHWAVNNGQSDAAEILIRSGVRLNPLDDLGRTPLDILQGDIPLRKTLRDAGCLSAKELAATYDWTSSGKTLDKLRASQEQRSRTAP